MGTGLRWILSAGVLALGTAAEVSAQTSAAAVSGASHLPQPGGLASLQVSAHEEIVREIDDPNTGDRWLLFRNDQKLGGPGLLVLATASHNEFSGAYRRGAVSATEAQTPPIIRAGDRLIVEEHTAIADAVLEARAMGSAEMGAAFNVRLTIGGKVVRAVALGPGRALLKPETGGRP